MHKTTRPVPKVFIESFKILRLAKLLSVLT
jgi:hypothetical protein